jgi:DNA-binding MltR family transcriptional regulator
MQTQGWFVETEEEAAAVAEIEDASDRAAAIVMASLVDARLTNALQAVMADSKKIIRGLFRPSGPLGSFSSKIDLAYVIGVISDDAHSDLHTMKDVRNLFAHQLKATTFSDPRISAMCQKFRLIETMICDIEVDAPTMQFPRFTLKVTNHARDLLTPRGRFSLNGRLFVAGFDEQSAKRRFYPDPLM